MSTLDLTHGGTIPSTRLVKVEFRKMTNTLAGRWLLIVTAGLTALAMLIAVWVSAANDMHITFNGYLQTCAYTSGLLLPVLGIMLVTQEWGQRTGMVTFVLEPRRWRVIAAKLITGLSLAWAVTLLAIVVAALANLLGSAIEGESPVWNFSWHFILSFLFVQTFAVLLGFSLAALTLNTPLAIVLFFILRFVMPIALTPLSLLWKLLRDALPWFDYNISQGALLSDRMTNETWAQLAVTTILWGVLPLAVGLIRITRAEVK